MTPPCHNHADYPAGTWHPQRPLSEYAALHVKPVLRWRPWTFARECMANSTTVAVRDGREVTAPELAGWNCDGCKWRNAA